MGRLGSARTRTTAAMPSGRGIQISAGNHCRRRSRASTSGSSRCRSRASTGGSSRCRRRGIVGSRCRCRWWTGRCSPSGACTRTRADIPTGSGTPTSAGSLNRPGTRPTADRLGSGATRTGSRRTPRLTPRGRPRTTGGRAATLRPRSTSRRLPTATPAIKMPGATSARKHLPTWSASGRTIAARGRMIVIRSRTGAEARRASVPTSISARTCGPAGMSTGGSTAIIGASATSASLSVTTGRSSRAGTAGTGQARRPPGSRLARGSAGTGRAPDPRPGQRLAARRPQVTSAWSPGQNSARRRSRRQMGPPTQGLADTGRPVPAHRATPGLQRTLRPSRARQRTGRLIPCQPTAASPDRRPPTPGTRTPRRPARYR